MSRAGKVALGAATFLPLLYVMVITLVGFALLFMHMGDALLLEEGPPEWYLRILALSFPTTLWIVGLTIFYVINVFRNGRLEKGIRVSWVVVLLLLNVFAIPVYWYLYIWREPTAAQPGPRPDF